MKNKYIRKVLCKIFMTSLVLIGSSYGLETKAISKYWDGVDTKVMYSAHVQDIGWQSSVSNNMTYGTTGMNKKVEAVKIANNTYSPYDIEYTTYSKVNGWSGVSKNGEISGTTGQNIPLTNMCIAIKDKEDRKYFAGYDVYYRVHVSDYGWRPWVRNGSLANDTDKTIEAFEIKMVENGVKENIVIEEPVIREEIDDDVFDDYDIKGLITLLLKVQLGKPYV